MGDQADGESEEVLVDVVASFPADAQAAEAVQPGDRRLDDPTEGAQAGAVGLFAFGDHRADAPFAKEPMVRVMVVAAVGEEYVRAVPGPTDHPGDRRDLVGQGQQMGDVVALRRTAAGSTRS